MTETTAITAQPRKVHGKANRRLAKAGLIPAVLYGAGRETMSLALERHDFEVMMSHHGAGSTLVTIAIEGEKKPINAVIKEVQHSPVKGTILHVDFLAIRMDEKLQAKVSFHFVGDAPGVKAGGILMHSLREVLVEALPVALPDSIEVDVSELEIGDSVNVADIEAPEGVEIVDDPEATICSITLPTAEPVEEEEVEEELEPELVGEEPAEEAEEEEGTSEED